MGEEDQRDLRGRERAHNSLEGFFAPRRVDYPVALPTYSLDDVVPPRDEQYVDTGPFAWMIVGHVMWATGLAIIALRGAGTEWFALAAAHLVALILVVVAWASRARWIAVARAVAWVSTPLFGVPVTVLGAEAPDVLSFLNEYLASFRTTPAPGVVPSFLVLNVLLSLPTFGAFGASVIYAHSLRHG